MRSPPIWISNLFPLSIESASRRNLATNSAFV
jgi:hypothetical protein